jgi:hypothetical protein
VGGCVLALWYSGISSGMVARTVVVYIVEFVAILTRRA